MEELKKLLGDLYEQVVAKLNGKELYLHDKGAKIIVDDGSLIPKHRLDEVIQQRDVFKAQAEKTEGDLKTLKTAAKGNDELTTKIAELQEANKLAKAEADKAVDHLKKSLVVKELLMNAGFEKPEYRDLLASQVDLDAVELYANGRDIKDFGKTIEKFKVDFAPMLGRQVIAGQKHNDGKLEVGEFFTREQVQNMSQEDVTKNLQKVQKSMETWTTH